MSTSTRNEQTPAAEDNVVGNSCIKIEADDSFPIIDKVSQIPEEVSMHLGNRSVQEASTQLINTTLNSLPVHPNHISNVKGPLLEVQKVDDECVDVKIVHSFRAHFRAPQSRAEVRELDDDWKTRLLDVTEEKASREENDRVSLEIVPGRRSTSSRYDEGGVSGEPTGCDIVPRTGEGLVSARLRNNPWVLDPRRIIVGRRIAVGGFAEVFVGKYEGTVVAIKRLIDGDVSAIAKFESEVAMLARLRHPNLILFMGYCMSPQLCIVSEFMQKGCLHSILRQRQGVALEQRLQRLVAVSVARGMAYLHSRNPPILHLDLKSPNILVDNSWRVKITDFGLSQMRFRTLVSHAAGSGAGSPHWMAPESLRSEHVDEKADVYSFGVVLWELITGKMPWESLNPMQVVGAVGFRGKTLPVPEEGDPVLIELFKRCCQQNPKDRPSFPDILDTFGREIGGKLGNEVEQPLLVDSKGKRLRDDTCINLGRMIEVKKDCDNSKRMLELVGPVGSPQIAEVSSTITSTGSDGDEKATRGQSTLCSPDEGRCDNKGTTSCVRNEGDEKPAPSGLSPFAMLALTPFDSDKMECESDIENDGRKEGPAHQEPEGCSQESSPQTPSPPVPTTSYVSPFAAMSELPFGDSKQDGESGENRESGVGVANNGSTAGPSPFAAFSAVPFFSDSHDDGWGSVTETEKKASVGSRACRRIENVSEPSVVTATLLSSQNHHAKPPAPFASNASEIAFRPGEPRTATVGPLTLPPFAGFSSVSIANDENASSSLDVGSNEVGMEQAGSGEWKIKVAEVEIDGHHSGQAEEVSLHEHEGASVGEWGSESMQEISSRDSGDLDEAGPSRMKPGGSISPTHTPVKFELEEGCPIPTAQREKGGFAIPPIVFTQDPSKAVLAGVFTSSSSLGATRKPRGFLISKFTGSQDPHTVSHPEGSNFFKQLSGSDSESEAEFS